MTQLACQWGSLMIIVLQFLTRKQKKTSSGSKHLELMYLIIINLVKDGTRVVEHNDTNPMLVDPLTKRLKPVILKSHIENMAIVSSFDVFG